MMSQIMGIDSLLHDLARFFLKNICKICMS